MNIAFQKNPGTIFSKLICWWTKSKYFHSEIFFSNGMSFSAQPLQRTKFHSTNYNNINWDFVKVDITTSEEELIYNWCKSESNCIYDYIGIIFSQFLKLSFQNPWWWFCSELCLAALGNIYNLNDMKPYQYSPGNLYDLLTKGNFSNEQNKKRIN